MWFCSFRCALLLHYNNTLLLHYSSGAGSYANETFYQQAPLNSLRVLQSSESVFVCGKAQGTLIRSDRRCYNRCLGFGPVAIVLTTSWPWLWFDVELLWGWTSRKSRLCMSGYRYVKQFTLIHSWLVSLFLSLSSLSSSLCSQASCRAVSVITCLAVRRKIAMSAVRVTGTVGMMENQYVALTASCTRTSVSWRCLPAGMGHVLSRCPSASALRVSALAPYTRGFRHWGQESSIVWWCASSNIALVGCWFVMSAGRNQCRRISNANS